MGSYVYVPVRIELGWIWILRRVLLHGKERDEDELPFLYSHVPVLNVPHTEAHQSGKKQSPH